LDERSENSKLLILYKEAEWLGSNACKQRNSDVLSKGLGEPVVFST